MFLIRTVVRSSSPKIIFIGDIKLSFVLLYFASISSLDSSLSIYDVFGKVRNTSSLILWWVNLKDVLSFDGFVLKCLGNDFIFAFSFNESS